MHEDFQKKEKEKEKEIVNHISQFEAFRFLFLLFLHRTKRNQSRNLVQSSNQPNLIT